MSAALVRILSVTRLVVFAIVCMLSLAVLITIGRFEHLAKRGVVQTTSEDSDDVIIPHSVPFDFALSAVTMVTLFVMLVVGFIGRNLFTSWIVVEIGWLGFLDILWLLSSV
ncbi:hypothetical protein PHLGIDRAFT_116412 [Phlebiopsis gigantea 11061_1 CR5-6]|uniref:MARVEL domain-containing protein n=1 Tax=Phlebiopsis gigantea (strain 11061_1 CR5-6) TaxID=745531 RepID=A0A0C3S280_PHLG1|nr:hypothetical protein PHLGIDRAFT_116412 [Phlebiopsis gigantea 11061_1 CR5-6]